MAYDEKLADRVRAVLKGKRNIGELKMFGGLCFTLKGNMAVGLTATDLMVRVGPDAYEACLAEKHARPMDFTGRPMKGYLFVDPKGLKTKPQLNKWVTRCLDFVGTLPPKVKKAKKRR
ncbi:MAG: TfoX/Sxy family protein [Planctomycetota bacterium]|jgi:TfoX/Sxy family transcriptional regulator of competence genes